jgi:hypothetical protein
MSFDRDKKMAEHYESYVWQQLSYDLVARCRKDVVAGRIPTSYVHGSRALVALSANHACRPNVKAIGYFWRDMLVRIESEWDVSLKYLVKSARIGRPMMSESLESWIHGPGRQVYEDGPKSIFSYHSSLARSEDVDSSESEGSSATEDVHGFSETRVASTRVHAKRARRS